MHRAATPLLATKLFVPAIRPGLVSRPHLIEQLNEGVRLGRKLPLLSAPAGYGKTTLLSEWAHSNRGTWNPQFAPCAPAYRLGLPE